MNRSIRKLPNAGKNTEYDLGIIELICHPTCEKCSIKHKAEFSLCLTELRFIN